MTKQPRTPNLVLRRIREDELRLTRARFAEALGVKAYEFGDCLEPDERYIARLEDGEIRCPKPACRRALAALCGRPFSELGFAAPDGARWASGGAVMLAGSASGAETLRAGTLRAETLRAETLGAETLGAEMLGAETLPGDLPADSEWPAWFGIKMAQLIALVAGWRPQKGQVSSLQGILAGEFAMFNASGPVPGEPGHAAYDQSRRQALTTLAALPLAFATADVLAADGSGVAAQESFLAQCGASITACWQLLRGSDLKVVDHILANYLVPLEGLARQHSTYQQAAAALASQAHRMRGIVALHLKQVALNVHHAQQAVRYAIMTSDVSAEVQAFGSLGWAYFYSSHPEQALAAFERMFTLETKMPSQRRSRLHAELAAVYGQQGREQDALRAAGRAEELFSDSPEEDPGYLRAELTAAMLGLTQGLAYLALAEQHEGHGYQRRAADVLGKIDRGQAAVSDRVRYEIANHQARAAVLLDDMDAFVLYIHRGLDGAALLGSRQRLREARQAWQLATDRWPNERRLAAVTERLQLTAGDAGQLR